MLCRRWLAFTVGSDAEESNGFCVGIAVDANAISLDCEVDATCGFCGKTKLSARFRMRLYCCVTLAFNGVVSLCVTVVFGGIVDLASELPAGGIFEGPATGLVSTEPLTVVVVAEKVMGFQLNT